MLTWTDSIPPDQVALRRAQSEILPASGVFIFTVREALKFPAGYVVRLHATNGQSTGVPIGTYLIRIDGSLTCYNCNFRDPSGKGWTFGGGSQEWLVEVHLPQTPQNF